MALDDKAYGDIVRLRAKCMLSTQYAIMTFVELRLATLISSGLRTTGELAEASKANPSGVAKLLRYLAHHDLVVADEGKWSLGPLGDLLTENHPACVSRFLHPTGAQARIQQAYAGLSHTVRTGEAGYPAVHGDTLWSELRVRPELGRSFADMMRVGSHPWVRSLTETYDWRRSHEVIDVGGGAGDVAVALATAHPHLSVNVLDLAHLAELAAERFASAGISDRARFAVADFFDELPLVADTALLTHVLHDWADDEAIAILGSCARAAGPEGRILVVDVVQGTEPTASAADSERDLLMYLLFGAEERSDAQWRHLIARAGLRLVDVTALPGSHRLLECAGAQACN